MTWISAPRQQLSSVELLNNHMLLWEITKPIIEIKMNPASLARKAAQLTGVRVGIEFELYVPDVITAEDQDPDWDQDQDIGYRFRDDWQDQILDFFTDPGSDYPVSDRSVDRGLQKAFEAFSEWVESEAVRRLRSEHGYQQMTDEEADERLEQLTQDITDSDFTDWASEHLITMSDFSSEFLDGHWPHGLRKLTSSGLLQVAESFQQFVAEPVRTSTTYHQTPRGSNAWILEPDGSLSDPYSESDAGLELISPAMPLQQMLKLLPAIWAWAQHVGAYTNSSCGLHLNISIETQPAAVDPVKFALLSGDEHMLRQFGRHANLFASSFTRHALQYMGRQVGPERGQINTTQLQQLLDQMRQGLKDLISVKKFPELQGRLSIHVRDNRVEIRTPGGDWLNMTPAEVVTVLLRYVVALASAMNPDQDRQEYLKKLHAFLQQALGRNQQSAASLIQQMLTGKLTPVQVRQMLSKPSSTEQPS